MRLDKGDIRDEGTKAAEGGEKPELPDLFAQIEIELALVEISAAMLRAETRLDRQPQRPEGEQEKADDRAADHNSFP